MKISTLATILEQADPDATYVIGDGIGVSVARSTPGAKSTAQLGAGIKSVQAQAQAVPDDSKCYISIGSADYKETAGAAANIKKIIEGMTSRGIRVVYIAFPPVDLKNVKPSSLPNDGSKTQGNLAITPPQPYKMATPAEIKQITVDTGTAPKTLPQLPMAELYKATGITEKYNAYRNEIVQTLTQPPMDMTAVVGLQAVDINTKDPTGLGATPNATGRIAKEAKEAVDNIPVTDEFRGDAPVQGVDDLSDEEKAKFDTNGDGVITNDEFNAGMARQGVLPDSLDVPASSASALGQVFNIIIQALAKREDKNREMLDLFRSIVAQGAGGFQANANGDPAMHSKYPPSGEGIKSNAQLNTTSGSKAEQLLILEARRKWQSVKDREIWIAALVAQCRAETANFKYNTEIWGPTAIQLTYDIQGPNPKKARRLGNDKPGDGYKYRGRGWIQLTGKANYRAASRVAGVDLVQNPEAAAQASVANKTAIHYFETRVMNKSKPLDVVAHTKLVNGGTNALNTRRANFEVLLNNLRKTSQTAMA